MLLLPDDLHPTNTRGVSLYNVHSLLRSARWFTESFATTVSTTRSRTILTIREMTDTRLTWYLRSCSYHRATKFAQICGVYQGKCLCFRIFISLVNFQNSPNSLEAYNILIDHCEHIYDDEAEEDLQDWVVTPFLPIFDQIETVDMRHEFRPQDYLFPQAYKYRFELFAVDEKKDSQLDCGVLEEPDIQGIIDTGYPKHPEWKRLRPEEVKICSGLDGDHCHERCLADFPTKVFVGGNVYFYKQTVDGDMTKALTETRAYKRMQISGINNTTQKEQEQENYQDYHNDHSKDSKENDGDDTYTDDNSEHEHEHEHEQCQDYHQDQQHNQDDQGYNQVYIPRV